jgi:hypothetical protein
MIAGCGTSQHTEHTSIIKFHKKIRFIIHVLLVTLYHFVLYPYKVLKGNMSSLNVRNV